MQKFQKLLKRSFKIVFLFTFTEISFPGPFPTIPSSTSNSENRLRSLFQSRNRKNAVNMGSQFILWVVKIASLVILGVVYSSINLTELAYDITFVFAILSYVPLSLFQIMAVPELRRIFFRF